MLWSVVEGCLQESGHHLQKQANKSWSYGIKISVIPGLDESSVRSGEKKVESVLVEVA